jgi:dinuclear metal center YbgI/SA1388 family protein
MTVGAFYGVVQSIAPLDLAAEGDNCGLLVGRLDRDTRRVLCALDITREVISEAKASGAGVILAHHPLFWQLDALTDTERESELALELCEAGIAAVCMHTNLDKAAGGVNDALAAVFLGGQTEVLEGGFCRAGRLPAPMDAARFAALAKERLRCGVVRYHNSGRPVEYLAVGSGSCGSEFAHVLEAGCDTFITGDVKHSLFLDAAHCGVNLFDCGHFATENVVFRHIIPQLERLCPDVQITLSALQTEPFSCL